MKNLFKVKRHSGTLARKNNGSGPVDEKYLKSRSVENQPISPNTLAKAPRIRGAVGVESVCPYCAVGCGQLIYTKGGQLIDIEGDPRSPINEGTLCPKGADAFQLAVNPHRVTHVLYRAPFSDRLSGWLSYTLSRSTREAHFSTRSGNETLETVPSEFDRTHVLNTSLSYLLGRGWRAGGRFVFYTGTPYSARDGSWPVPPYNAYRTPAFFRIDVQVEKRWHLGETGSLAFVREGLNVTMSKEVTGLGLDCQGKETANGGFATTCQQSTTGPLTIPSVGVEAFF